MAFDSNDKSEDLTPFQIRHAREIVRILTSVCTKQERIVVTGPAGPVAGRLIDVDGDASVLTFEAEAMADVVPGEEREEVPPPPGTPVDVEGTLDQVKITFRTTVRNGTPSNPRMLQMDFPGHVIRLQRREFFRVHVPSHPPVRCRLKAVAGAPDGLVTQVKNLSTGGLMLLDPSSRLTAEPGTEYSDCILELPGTEPITCTLRLCNMFDANAGDPTAGKLLGMQFVNPSTRSLSLIQRYSAKLEVSQRAIGAR